MIVVTVCGEGRGEGRGRLGGLVQELRSAGLMRGPPYYYQQGAGQAQVGQQYQFPTHCYGYHCPAGRVRLAVSPAPALLPRLQPALPALAALGILASALLLVPTHFLPTQEEDRIEQILLVQEELNEAGEEEQQGSGEDTTVEFEGFLIEDELEDRGDGRVEEQEQLETETNRSAGSPRGN